jgi:hypothetical protein
MVYNTETFNTSILETTTHLQTMNLHPAASSVPFLHFGHFCMVDEAINLFNASSTPLFSSSHFAYFSHVISCHQRRRKRRTKRRRRRRRRKRRRRRRRRRWRRRRGNMERRTAKKRR